MDIDFFVMLYHQKSGVYLPMMKDDENVAFYETEELARSDARDNSLGQHYGYEIFQMGCGDQ